MKNLNSTQITQAASILKNGGIIAYPTEAVYGLGCDPFNQTAVERLLNIKQREISKGLILIAASWEQVADLVKPIPDVRLAMVQATWPGPMTWLFPKSHLAPAWITGDHDTIAIRITAHLIAKNLCASFGSPIVSTSANIAQQPAARDAEAVEKIFGQKIDMILSGEIGRLKNPTEIRDVFTNNIIRRG